MKNTSTSRLHPQFLQHKGKDAIAADTTSKHKLQNQKDRNIPKQCNE